MPKYRHDWEALTMACGGRRACVLFALGSRVKCTSSYLYFVWWSNIVHCLSDIVIRVWLYHPPSGNRKFSRIHKSTSHSSRKRWPPAILTIIQRSTWVLVLVKSENNSSWKIVSESRPREAKRSHKDGKEWSADPSTSIRKWRKADGSAYH